MNVIAFCGLTKSGKNTAAFPLVEQGFAEIGFADKVKEIVAELYNVPLEWMHDPILKETPCRELFGKTPRQVLQPIATEAFRDMVSTNTWINYVYFKLQRIEKRYTEVAQKPVHAVITDLRFPNEAEMLKSIGATIVYIVDPNAPPPQNHSSESQVALVGRKYADITLVNDKTLMSIRELQEHSALFSQRCTPVELHNYNPYVGVDAQSAYEHTAYLSLMTKITQGIVA
jgi:hypothetical protein